MSDISLYRLIGEQDRLLRNLVGATRDYWAGCECSGTGIVTDCPGTHSEGCCGVCERRDCECCAELRVAIYEVEALLLLHRTTDDFTSAHPEHPEHVCDESCGV